MAAEDLETTTVTLETDDATDEMEIPVDLIDLLTEGDESTPTVVADIAMFGFAQRVHSAVHHGQGEPDEQLEAIEAATMDRFEERFGTRYEDLIEHSH
ncbi:hypothetical protein HLRTI_000836 [Halorhabdus tiamatea SARL4B]|uniref:Uncharacterized protein n=1 Tax=Halorhabdus tiamatea SARL4B TaxID=1033806 RepID=F7PL84_9EURY|nr:hypothetical protein [Halorhabdus tiamatea]ERJ06983.1 hypothetical protein HLRTI_000836 [Halorhabdus tiamatea SARL4B]CCQ34755.1 conserved hypothetical protein [Halorhabdus tiamatea SARL4B]